MKKLILRIAKYYWVFIASFQARNVRPQSPNRRILITKFDGLGDFFLLTPFLQHLCRNNYEIVCIGSKLFVDIPKHLDLSIEFIPLNRIDLPTIRSLTAQLKKDAFCLAVNLSMSAWGGILVNQSRASVKVGLLQEREYYVYKGSKFLYDTILSYHPATHNFDVLQNVFKHSLDISPAPKQLILPLNRNNISTDKFIAIHPYASWQPKRWPHFLPLINELINRGYLIHLIGTEKEHTTNNWLTQVSHLQNLHIINLTSIEQLMNEIDSCYALIGNDSGPAHYSSLIGKPTTVIWGPGYFERIHPVGNNVQICRIESNCSPCRQKFNFCRKGKNYCLSDMPVSMVLSHFEKTISSIQDLHFFSTEKHSVFD